MSEQSFDLTECARQRYANTRGLRIAFASVAGAIAAAGIVGFVYQFAHGTLYSGFRVLYGIPYYIAAGEAALLGWASNQFAPGASWVTVGDEGVKFLFSGHTKELIRWTDRHFRLDLEDDRSSSAAQKYGIAGYANIRHHPATRLTGEALDALVSAARARQLAVTVRERGGRWSLAGPRRVCVEVRPPSSGPVRPS